MALMLGLVAVLFRHIMVFLSHTIRHLHTFDFAHLLMSLLFYYGICMVTSCTLPATARDLYQASQRLSEIRILVVLVAKFLVETFVLE